MEQKDMTIDGEGTPSRPNEPKEMYFVAKLMLMAPRR